MAPLLMLIMACSTTGNPLPTSQDGDADHDRDDDADADGDGDSDVDVDGDSSRDCLEPTCDSSWLCCPEVCELIHLRITALRMTRPWGLALTQNVVDENLDFGRFPWLIELDLIGERVRTGAGSPWTTTPESREDFCSDQWSQSERPSEWTDVELVGSSFSTTSPIPSVTIVVYTESNDLVLLELPFTHIELVDVELDESQTLIGAPNNTPGAIDFASDWDTAGMIHAWIEWNDAREAHIPALGMTLCHDLCGRDCDEVEDPMVDCPTPPEPIPGTSDLGYELSASFGAGAVSF